MDDFAPSTSDLSPEPEFADTGRARPILCRRPHVLLAGSAATCTCVRAAIGEDYHVIPVLDGQRALRLLRSLRHLLMIVVDDDLAGMDAPALFARLAGNPEVAQRHSYVFLTSGTRHFDVEFAWHLELLHVTVVHIPAPQGDLLDTVTRAARLARLRALEGAVTRGGHIGAS